MTDDISNESQATDSKLFGKPAIATKQDIQFDNAIIGGGVIGLSIACELSSAGQNVALIDSHPAAISEPDTGNVRERGKYGGGRQASWAGAGIIPPPSRAENAHFAEQLHRLSYDLHLKYSKKLKCETGIDNGLRRCGGIYIARNRGEAASLVANVAMYEHQQVRANILTPVEATGIEPGLQHLVSTGKLTAAVHLPDEMQIRNPRHLKALRAACKQKGVTFINTRGSAVQMPEIRFESDDNTIKSVRLNGATIKARSFCVAAGAWSYDMLTQLGVETKVFPMRGQILLYRSESLTLSHILNEGPRYIVPRGDGLFLVGSLEEEVGFANHPTDRGRSELAAFAMAIAPELNESNLIDHWSGLRPATLDGLPYIGRLSSSPNVFYATGHYRLGITMSTGTARLIRQMMLGEKTDIDVSGLAIQRGI